MSFHDRIELERHLRLHGCQFHHAGGKHDIWINMGSGTRAPVPRHRHLKRGTVRGICRQLNIPIPNGL